jgi:flagellar hook assembly protein FlgD
VIATTITQLDTFALFEKKSAIQELASTDLSNLAVQPRILSPQYAQTVTISFDLGQRAEVTAKVYNLAGRFVQVLCENRPMNPGSNTIEWNGGDYNGEHCPSGLYIICVQANGQTATKTVMVVNK